MRLVLVSVVLAASLVAVASAANEVAVARVVRNHVTWTLLASDGPGDSYCLTIQKQGHLNAASCGSLFSGQAHGISYLSHTGAPAPNYIAGPVVAKARSISVTFSDGTHLTIPTIAPPKSLDPRIRFYLHLMPLRARQPVRIVGLDATKQVVAVLYLHP